MRSVFDLNDENYARALRHQTGSGIIGFRGVRRQRGGGFDSILFNLAKYAIPVFEKYVLPHAKEAVQNIITDVKQGSSIKSAIKTNAKKAIKAAGKSLIRNTLNQTGKGITSRKRKRLKIFEKHPDLKPPKRFCISSVKKKKNNKTIKPANRKGLKQTKLKDFGFRPIF